MIDPMNKVDNTKFEERMLWKSTDISVYMGIPRM